MELIGVIVILLLVFVWVAFMAKDQRAIGWWMQTPHCDEEYKRKRLMRIMEDAQDELDRMKEK